jgi:hypothetical protein
MGTLGFAMASDYNRATRQPVTDWIEEQWPNRAAPC